MGKDPQRALIGAGLTTLPQIWVPVRLCQPRKEWDRGILAGMGKPGAFSPEKDPPDLLKNVLQAGAVCCLAWLKLDLYRIPCSAPLMGHALVRDT